MVFYLGTKMHNTVKGKHKKGKVVLSLTKHHAMKTWWGVDVKLRALLTSALDGGGQLHAPAL